MRRGEVWWYEEPDDGLDMAPESLYEEASANRVRGPDHIAAA